MDSIFPDIRELAETFRVLEASLLYWRFVDRGLWPVYEWSDEAVRQMARLLHWQTHMLICRRVDSPIPRYTDYASDPDAWVSRPELIRLTGTVLHYYTAASIKRNETFMIGLLEQVHYALIGVHFLRRPGETSCRIIPLR
jgi:hypothetical protein